MTKLANENLYFLGKHLGKNKISQHLKEESVSFSGNQIKALGLQWQRFAIKLKNHLRPCDTQWWKDHDPWLLFLSSYQRLFFSGGWKFKSQKTVDRCSKHKKTIDDILNDFYQVRWTNIDKIMCNAVIIKSCFYKKSLFYFFISL